LRLSKNQAVIYRTQNPATGVVLQEFAPHDFAAAERAIGAGQVAFLEWRTTAYEDRARLLHKLATGLRERRDEFAVLMATEMGKPVRDGVGEVEKCALACEYYARHGGAMLTPEVIASDASRSYVVCAPLGLVFAIMPWNFPFWQVFRAMAPTLMAGNGLILKHAPNVPGCAQAIVKLTHDAGFPQQLVQNLFLDNDTAARVIDHPQIRGVTLTGSTRAGRAVAGRAGAALKKTVLELGGSDPYIILDDADLTLAAERCAASRLINGGQSCIAAKRFIVLNEVYDEFLERFIEFMRAPVMGDPLEAATTLGPMARPDLRDELHHQVRSSVEMGARCILGGAIPADPPYAAGAFYPPTVLVDVTPTMPAATEELFGPVAAVLRVPDLSTAIDIANRSSYGLGAAIFTRDTARAEALAAGQLEAGCVFINSFVKSDPRLPFGGVKDSGYGRELSHHGLKEFVNLKTVYLE
jgi:succinate-semialdehyde dehydrogenase/glutarate-semialdehyde dehydrogenase